MNNTFKFLLISCAILTNTILQLQAQCQAPSSIDAQYCPGQPGTIDVVDNASNVKYAWYDSPIDNIPSYGIDGDGREFISSGTQNASASFYYSRETYMHEWKSECAHAHYINIQTLGNCYLLAITPITTGVECFTKWAENWYAYLKIPPLNIRRIRMCYSWEGNTAHIQTSISHYWK